MRGGPPARLGYPAGMRGLLLVNLGTPEAPTPSAVRRYLAQFLADGRVLDLPAPGRYALLYGAILPFRPFRSAHAYQKIWHPTLGSPLLAHGRALREAVATRLGQGWTVALAMRYGQPGLAAALAALQAAGADEILVAPLYPQSASSTTGSTLAEVYRLAGALPVVPALRVLPPFFQHPAWVAATAAIAAPHLADFAPDHVLFSFHGVPERQVRFTDLSPSGPGAHCLASPGCCDTLGPANRACYRAHCAASARALAAALGLADGTWSMSFQSRLGRIPWIRPYTDEVLPSLAAQGRRRVAVLCPSFVADCLETLEEIGIGARESFAAATAGQGELRAIPCPNGDPRWADALVQLVREAWPNG